MEFKNLENLEVKYVLDKREARLNNELYENPIFRDMDVLVIRKRIVFKNATKKEFQEVHRLFGPTPSITSHSYKYRDTKVKVNSPYRIDSNAKYHGPLIQIEWFSGIDGEYDIEVELKHEEILDFLIGYTRHPNHHERHYYLGMTINQIRRQEIQGYSFKHGEQKKYYGGHLVSYSAKGNAEIINHLLK